MPPTNPLPVPPPDPVGKLPLSCANVLLLACGDGAAGAEYKRRNPAARVTGIERDPALAGIAAGVLDRVFCLNLDVAPLPRLDPPFDAIMFAPGLFERLAEPAETLRDVVRLLAPTGMLVLCVPNFQHWEVAESVLRGLPMHGPDGAPGRLGQLGTDFVRASLRAAGLHVQDVEQVTLDGAQAAAFVRALRPGLLALGIDPAAYAARAAPSRFIWRATAAPRQMLSVVSTMLNPVGGVSQVRVVEPLCALAGEPWVQTRVVDQAAPLTAPPEAVEGAANIFILHRPALLGPGGLAPLRSLLARGHMLVCEFDDHPSLIPVLHQSNVQNFRAVHAIQTSTDALANVFAAENPEVAVFPNAIPRLSAPRNFLLRDTDAPARMRLVFGALNREDDWPDYVEALNRAATAAGPRLGFEIISDRALFDALDTPHKRFTPLCDYATYLDILSRCEIAFMPLRDTLFNRCKSDLKYLEAAAHRLVALASPVAYGDSIADGVTGMLFRDPGELHDRLLGLLADPAGARAIADRARAEVARHRMAAYQTARRAAWYRSLWARHEELTAALYARVPELRP